MWEYYLSRLCNIAGDIKWRDAFNDNFINVLLKGQHHINHDDMIGLVDTANLNIIFNPYRKNVDHVLYAIHTSLETHFVFSDYSSLRVTQVGKEFNYAYSSNGKSTWVRLQHVYYLDVGHKTSHSKRPFNESETLTLIQMIDRPSR